MSQDENFFNEQPQNNPNSNSSDKSTVNGLGIAGLVVGIIGLLVSFIPCFGLFALFIAILGIVLSAIGLYMANKGKFEKGLVIAGLVISILAAMIAGIQWAVIGTGLNQANKTNNLFLDKLKEEIKKDKQEREGNWDQQMEDLENEIDSLNAEESE